MTYAAVASLSQTIHLILNYHQDSLSPELKIPITSIHENVIFLQSFLEDYPDEADNWEERMRVVTNEAEDIIEILVSNSLLDSTVGSSEPKSKKGKYEVRSDLNLQTLDEAVNLVCSRDNLEMIPNLKKLCLFYTEFSHPEDYQLFNLIYFQKLEVLKIRIWGGCGIFLFPFPFPFPFPLALNSTLRLRWENITACLAFPPTLKRLSLSGLKLPWGDMKIVGLLPHLQELQLRDEACVGRKWETSEGGFSHLNFLLIDNSDLEHWITAATHFPVLNCLVLLDCRNLREVPNDIGHIPTLELIEVDKSNASLLASAKSIQQDQQSSGNHSLQVVAVPIPFEKADILTKALAPRPFQVMIGELGLSTIFALSK